MFAKLASDNCYIPDRNPEITLQSVNRETELLYAALCARISITPF
jgi:hypothetical protein